ncbi:hypothetical protein DFH06DRAFT_919325, partial [Mycena polygramma]
IQSYWNTGTAWTSMSAQKSYLHGARFDAADEARLCEFLLEQGVVAPYEQLVLFAKSQY